MSRLNRLWILAGGFLICFVVATSSSWGQEAVSQEAAAEAAETPEFFVAPVEGMMTDSQIAEGPEAAHNAWMLVCCALVLFMTAPGLAMFYGGLVRRKNVLSVMMQCVFLMGMMTFIWAIYGYSLAFGGDGGWIGNNEYLFMNGVQREWNGVEPVTPMEGSMTRMTHMLF